MFKEFVAAKDFLRIRKNQKISYLRANFSGDFFWNFQTKTLVGKVCLETISEKVAPIFNLKVCIHSVYYADIYYIDCLPSFNLKLVHPMPI